MKCIVALIAVVACATSPVRAQGSGDPVKGAAIARQMCAECHAVERGQRRSSNAEAPAFEDIAKTPGMTSIALTAALRTSHDRMPNVILSGDEMSDVVSYLLSLK